MESDSSVVVICGAVLSCYLGLTNRRTSLLKQVNGQRYPLGKGAGFLERNTTRPKKVKANKSTVISTKSHERNVLKTL